jgi:predicted MFS family arabinose efflux permease
MLSPESIRTAGPPLALSVLAQLPLGAVGIGLLVHTRHLTGSYAAAGLVSGVFAAAGGVGGPVLGRLADRRGRARLLVVSATASALALAAVALAPARVPVGGLVVLTAVAGGSTPPVAACMRSVLPRLVRQENLRAAFALESSALELTFIAGPPLALAIGAAWSTRAALAACAVVLLVATVTFACTTPLDIPSASRGARRATGSLSSPAVRTLVLALACVGLLFGAVEVAVTATAATLAGTATAAPLLAVWGVGSLVGGVVATRLGGGARTPAGLAQLVAALAFTHAMLATTTANLVLTGVVLAGAGSTIAPTYATVYAMADRAVPAGAATEAFAWLSTAVAIGAAGGAAAAGALIDHGGPRPVLFLAAAAGCAALALTLTRARTLSLFPAQETT